MDGPRYRLSMLFFPLFLLISISPSLAASILEGSVVKVSDGETNTFAEHEAKAKRAGLWQDKNPIPLWEFRTVQHRR